MDAGTIRRARERVGSVLREKWHLDKLIGVGGMAAVYAATHRNKKRGAVKLMHAEIGANEDTRARFLREGYVANHVDHPGAVSVLDDDVAEDGSVYLVMELLEGRNLEHITRTRTTGRFEIGEVLAIADAALDVLGTAHERGIVHRDIKPDNLFITKNGQLKVLDFGIARVRKEAPSASDTATGVAIGTPMYMPPEQALGEWSRVDGRTDVWAIGASMFALLSGREVRNAENLQKLFLSAMTEPIDRLGSVAPEMPAEICAIVDRAVAFKMEDRFGSAREMQAAVRALRGRWPGVLTCDAAPIDPGSASGGDVSGSVPAATPGVAPAQTPPSYTPSEPAHFQHVARPSPVVVVQPVAITHSPLALSAQDPSTAVPSTTPAAPFPISQMALAPTVGSSAQNTQGLGLAPYHGHATPAGAHTLPAGRSPMNPTPSVAVLAAARAPARRSPLVPLMLVGAVLVGVGAGVAFFVTREGQTSRPSSSPAVAEAPPSAASPSTSGVDIQTAPAKGAAPPGAPSASSSPSAAPSAALSSSSSVAAVPTPTSFNQRPPVTQTAAPPPTPKSSDPFSKY